MSSTSRTQTPPVQDFAKAAARLLRDRHCEDIRLLDVRGLSQVCDFVLIGTGTSDRQMKSVAHELGELGAEQDNKVFRSSRDDGGTWIVVDFVDVVVHLFEPNQRAYYDIESLWADAEPVDWERDGPKRSKRVQAPKSRSEDVGAADESQGRPDGALTARKVVKKAAKKPTAKRPSGRKTRKERGRNAE